MKNQDDKDALWEAKKFLGDLLNDTMEWGCVDFQHEHARQFIEILGAENVPTCLKKGLVSNEQ